MTVSDRDSFLTARRLAQTEGILAGGSCGLALHAALQVGAELGDPDAMVVVILPTGAALICQDLHGQPGCASTASWPETPT